MSSNLSSPNTPPHLQPISIIQTPPIKTSTSSSPNCHNIPQGFGFEFESVLERRLLEHSNQQRARLQKYSRFGMDEYTARQPSPEEMREKYHQLLESELNDVHTPSPSPTISPASNSPIHLPISYLPIPEELGDGNSDENGDELINQNKVNEAYENAIRSRSNLYELISNLHNSAPSNNSKFWQEVETIYKHCHINLSQLWSLRKDSVYDEDTPYDLRLNSSKSQPRDTSNPSTYNWAENVHAPPIIEQSRSISKRVVEKLQIVGKAREWKVKTVRPQNKASNKSYKVTKIQMGRRPVTRSIEGKLWKGI